MQARQIWKTLAGVGFGATVLIVGLIQAGVAGAASPAAGGPCSLASMHGTYIAAVTGWTVGGTSPLPFAFAFEETYDGKGSDRGIYTYSSNGAIYRRVAFSGTYAVNANCTGTETDTDTFGVITHSDNFIAPDGSRMTWTTTDATVVESGSETRVSGGPNGS